MATSPHEVDWLAEEHALVQSMGHQGELLDRDQVQAEVYSPTCLGGFWDRHRVAMVDPARLAWGLREACLSWGVRIYEGTPVESIGRGLLLKTPHGLVDTCTRFGA